MVFGLFKLVCILTSENILVGIIWNRISFVLLDFVFISLVDTGVILILIFI